MNRIAIALWVLTLATSASAQPGVQFINAPIERHRASESVGREIDRVAAAHPEVWVGYRIAATPGPGDMCSDAQFTRLMLEPATAVTILARFEARALVRLRTVTDGCRVDAGGVPVVWLDGVTSDASASWLTAVIGREPDRTRRDDITSRAVAALSWHDGAAALGAVIDLARNDPRSHLRSQALFWLAHRAGQRAVATIVGAVNDDPETPVKKQAVFALSQLPDREAVPLLIHVARTNANREVRKQAMFWLGQSKDARALTFFEELLGR